MPSGVYKRKSIEQKFLEKIQKTKFCWLWIGPLNPYGYGQLNGDGIRTLAHRFSWEYHHKACILPKINVCHKCDNPKCVHPLHLFLGTQRDNVLDMMSKNRGAGQFSSKTHCKYGHPLSGDNVRVGKRQKHCRTCGRNFNRKYRMPGYKGKN